MSSSNGFQSSYANERPQSSAGGADREPEMSSDPASSSFFLNDYKKSVQCFDSTGYFCMFINRHRRQKHRASLHCISNTKCTKYAKWKEFEAHWACAVYLNIIPYMWIVETAEFIKRTWKPSPESSLLSWLQEKLRSKLTHLHLRTLCLRFSLQYDVWNGRTRNQARTIGSRRWSRHKPPWTQGVVNRRWKFKPCRLELHWVLSLASRWLWRCGALLLKIQSVWWLKLAWTTGRYITKFTPFVHVRPFSFLSYLQILVFFKRNSCMKVMFKVHHSPNNNTQLTYL